MEIKIPTKEMHRNMHLFYGVGSHLPIPALFFECGLRQGPGEAVRPQVFIAVVNV